MKDYMLIPIQIKSCEIKQEESGKYAYVEGYASIYNNIDLGRDRILPGFFTDDLKERGNIRPALWQHCSSEPVGVNIYTDDSKGLKFVAKLPMDDSLVTGRVLPQLEIGSIQGASIGYSTLVEKTNQEESCRDLIKGKLWESSFVTFPMNEEAIIISVTKAAKLEENRYVKDFAAKMGIIDTVTKAVPGYKDYSMAEQETKWDKAKAVKQIRKYTDSMEEPSEKYKNGFMFYDSGKETDYTGYKMPYVYYMEGKFRAIPKALSAIVGAIAGARGGIDIPENDKKKIKSQVNKYYKKMGREEPFKGDKIFIDSGTMNHMEAKDLDVIFEANTVLSTKSKETIKKILLYSEKRVGKKQNSLGELLKELKAGYEKL